MACHGAWCSPWKGRESSSIPQIKPAARRIARRSRRVCQPLTRSRCDCARRCAGRRPPGIESRAGGERGCIARHRRPGARPGFVAPDLIVCDVSFISLKLALAPALALAAPGAKGLFLVKPQFEAGRQAIGKGGLLRDAALAPRIADDLRVWLDAQPGWRA